jgi:hypothetical protein
MYKNTNTLNTDPLNSSISLLEYGLSAGAHNVHKKHILYVGLEVCAPKFCKERGTKA